MYECAIIYIYIYMYIYIIGPCVLRYNSIRGIVLTKGYYGTRQTKEGCERGATNMRCRNGIK